MTHDLTTTSPPTIVVVGIGLLGRGIATCFLGYGFRIIGCDHDRGARDRSRRYIDRGLGELSEHVRSEGVSLAAWAERYHETDLIDDWPACDFVVVSVVEELAAKRAVFDEIESVIAPAAPVASNTSSIPITLLQEGRRHPMRFLGMHWFEPAHATCFLELIPGEQTSNASTQIAFALARQSGKEPSVLAKDIPGFIVNRLGYAMYREALNLLELGVADAATIDRSFRNACGVWSTILGPFQWMDLNGGPNLYKKCMERVLPTLSNASEIPEAIRSLAADDARRVANGHGFYRNSPEDAAAVEKLFQSHAWRARELMDSHFPL